MNPITHTKLGFLLVLMFISGGLIGSLCMFVAIVNEMDKGPKVAWRAKFIFWRWYRNLCGDSSFETIGQNADKARRELFGLVLMGTMQDLGGPRPIPQSRDAVDALLAEAERRYHVKYGDSKR